MLRHLGTFAILAVCLFAIVMGGCGSGEDDEDDPIKFLSANPADGSTIQWDTTITVIFSGPPSGTRVTSSSLITTFSTVGNEVTISGPFAAGPLRLEVNWDDGFFVFNYIVSD